MNSDKAIENLFLAQKPHFDDGDEFMAKLTKRLDAVEIVKQYQKRTLRHYRVMMAVAFVVGIISGTVSTIWLFSSPVEMPLLDFHSQTAFLLWLTQNARLLAAAVFPMLMTFAACIVTSNVLDILEMRRNMKRGDFRFSF